MGDVRRSWVVARTLTVVVATEEDAVAGEDTYGGWLNLRA